MHAPNGRSTGLAHGPIQTASPGRVQDDPALHDSSRRCRFDMLLVQPARTEPSAGIIFLHTPGANFALEGWLLAECGRRANAITLCPSIGPATTWQAREGIAILHAAIHFLKRSSVERIYLSAISVGVPGLLRVAAVAQSELAGLILISGIAPTLPPPALPTLLLRGAEDCLTPAALFQKYARKAGKNCTLRELPGGQFLLPKHRTTVAKAISTWLHQQVRCE